MMPVLVDSNVILDIFTEDPEWFEWSSRKLAEYAEKDTLIINPIIYAEISIRFEKEALPPEVFVREELPWEAAFLAGKCFLLYRKRRGKKTSPLPDFYIGAHAAVRGYVLLTRDAKRYSFYFPKLKLIAPEENDPKSKTREN
ncbi:type II toxin-antitoxin system VapC family toxin [Thermosulfuriphilus ammonigenes]|uniref:Type II toxin-antitoxin system VapC family toxin n=1 Tax=Thermosulfuriphilus ammonigenes TaxID=1936021 RepID=A0A6G7PYF8_9BACT|nr:type II toxin-antitoxin system VapC family toxin [Thermosulfuriphilus ammonigenes]